MTCNIGPTDQIIRIIIGAALAGYGVLSLPGMLGIVLGLVGWILLVTAIVGECPAYSIFKINTYSTNKVEPV